MKIRHNILAGWHVIVMWSPCSYTTRWRRPHPRQGRYPVTDGDAFLTLDTTPSGARKAYRHILSERIEAVSSMSRKNGAHFHALSCNDPLTTSLRHGLQHRYH